MPKSKSGESFGTGMVQVSADSVALYHLILPVCRLMPRILSTWSAGSRGVQFVWPGLTQTPGGEL